MNIETRQAYSEVNSFLEILDRENYNKIPRKLRNYFKREMDQNYIPKIDPKIPIKNQNLKRKTIAIISGLNLQYWCSEEKRRKLLEIYSNNEIEYQKKVREQYNPDNLFKNRTLSNSLGESTEETNGIIVYNENKNIFIKLLEKIKSIFKFW